MYGLGAIIDKGRHHAAHHPCAAQGAYQQQDDKCARHAGHILGDGFLKTGPRHVKVCHAHQYAEGGRYEQRYLAGSAKRVAAKGAYGDDEQNDQHHQRHD